MTKGKKLYLAIVVAIIVALGIWSIILDFSRFSSLNFEYDIYPSALLKRINVILAASIAWSAGRDRLSPRDSVMMKIIFLFICLAESAFAFRCFTEKTSVDNKLGYNCNACCISNSVK